MFACDILCSVPLVEVKENRILQHIYISSIESLLLMKNICLALASNHLPSPLKEFPSLPFSERRLPISSFVNSMKSKRRTLIKSISSINSVLNFRVALSLSLSHSHTQFRWNGKINVTKLQPEYQRSCKIIAKYRFTKECSPFKRSKRACNFESMLFKQPTFTAPHTCAHQSHDFSFNQLIVSSNWIGSVACFLRSNRRANPIKHYFFSHSFCHSKALRKKFME